MSVVIELNRNSIIDTIRHETKDIPDDMFRVVFIKPDFIVLGDYEISIALFTHRTDSEIYIRSMIDVYDNHSFPYMYYDCEGRFISNLTTDKFEIRFK